MCLHVGWQQCDPTPGQHPEEGRLGHPDPTLPGPGSHRPHHGAPQLPHSAQTAGDGWHPEEDPQRSHFKGEIKKKKNFMVDTWALSSAYLQSLSCFHFRCFQLHSSHWGFKDSSNERNFGTSTSYFFIVLILGLRKCNLWEKKFSC